MQTHCSLAILAAERGVLVYRHIGGESIKSVKTRPTAISMAVRALSWFR